MPRTEPTFYPPARVPKPSPPQRSVPTLSVAEPRWIQLRLKRSQRRGGLLKLKVVFALDARADLSRHARTLVTKYGLGPMVVYDSKARTKHTEIAMAHFEASRTGSLAGLARGLVSTAMAATKLRITVGSLTAGHHIACRDLGELIGAEEAIREACNNVRGYLEVAESFDGREDVVEF